MKTPKKAPRLGRAMRKNKRLAYAFRAVRRFIKSQGLDWRVGRLNHRVVIYDHHSKIIGTLETFDDSEIKWTVKMAMFVDWRKPR